MWMLEAREFSEASKTLQIPVPDLVQHEYVADARIIARQESFEQEEII